MIHSRAGRQFAYPAVLLVTMIVALLPVSWRRSWQPQLAQVVQVPFRPFSHFAVAVCSWLRPPPSPLDAVPSSERDLETIIADRDLAQAAYLAERQRVRELEEQLQQLQQVPVETLRRAHAPIVAHITSRSPNAPRGVVSLGLQGEAGEMITPGTVAVYAGVHLIGRIASDAGGVGFNLVPLANRSTGVVRGSIHPGNLPLQSAGLVYLEPTGGGALAGDVDRSFPVERGDVVRLDDNRWPDTAQGMVIGRVEAANIKDEEPLRKRVIVRPTYQVHEIAYVTLLVEQPGFDGAGALGDGGTTE